jgi:predicted glycoside hydrolase/deacetylase ChbG (UPF0249 family)
MKTNPLLKHLGFDQHDRVVIIHADDIGMCQATVTAYADLIESGSISSGAVMVPCPWFLQTAEYCRQNPEADMGIHLTLTSEWITYRWGPISTRDPATGLLDDEGFFHHRVHQVHKHAQPQAIHDELNTQLMRAKGAGIGVTHIDNHMGSLAHTELLSIYAKLAQDHHLPSAIPAGGPENWQALGRDPEMATNAARYVRDKIDARTFMPIDHIISLRVDQPLERMAQAKAAFDSLQPGLTHLAIHPALDTPELRAVTPHQWQSRVGDYEVFRSDELQAYIKKLGIQVIGYKPLQQLMPG